MNTIAALPLKGEKKMKKILCVILCLCIMCPVFAVADEKDDKLAAIMDEVVALTPDERAEFVAGVMLYMGFAGEGDLIQKAFDNMTADSGLKVQPSSTSSGEKEIESKGILYESSRRNPAHVGQCVEIETSYLDHYTAVMRVTLDDFYRGESFQSESAGVYMPDLNFENGEYVAAKVTVEFVELKSIDVEKAGTDDPEIMVDAVMNFNTFDSSGAQYDNVNYNFGNKKGLKSLREGGKTEGYFMFEIYSDDAAPYLVYTPGLFGGTEVWFALN